MDEIIQLYHERKIRRPLFPVRGVRRVIFRDLKQIPSLLGFTSRSIPMLEADRKAGASYSEASAAQQDLSETQPVDSTTSARKDEYLSGAAIHASSYNSEQRNTPGHRTGEVEAVDVEERDEVEELEIDPTVDAETLVQSMTTIRDQGAVHAPSDEEIRAARIIETMYFRKLRRRRSAPKGALSEARARCFVNCWTESKQMEWSRAPHRLSPSRYRFLFLGPLPHLLVCLERANTSTFELKLKAKKRLTTAGHLEIEDVQMRMTEAKWVYFGNSQNLDTHDEHFYVAVFWQNCRNCRKLSSPKLLFTNVAILKR